MELTTALALPFAVLLLLSGHDKLRSPAGARQALSLVGAPSHPVLIRALPLAEVAIGVAFVVTGAWWAAGALAAAYLAFSVIVARELRSASGAACGCFGDTGGSLTGWHLVVDLAGVAAASLAAVAPTTLAPWSGLGWLAPAAAVAAAAVAVLLRAVIVDLPPALTLARAPEVSS